ncbi:hypothetical protein P7C71_g1750, partial [Lecanoromycetidae sp. Uapishka_2]
MPSIKALFSASAIAFFTTTDAHMFLAQPPPYGNPSSSPLDAGGSNFPCKATSNTGGPVTNMVVGAEQVMKFNGTAVHGGGSCQISLTKDNPATASSKWMVIHSIMSGCMARNQPGNLPDGAAGPQLTPDPDTYNYTIPQGIDAGTYTLAWTWFNKIGNREMYMNCANVKITAGSSKRDAPVNETEEYSIPELSERAAPSFPDMFKANIPTTDCTTPDSHDVQFPDPGASVETASPSPVLAPPTGPKCGAAGTSASTSSSGSSGSSAGSSSGSSSGASSGASGASPSAASPASSPAASGASGASGASSAAPVAASPASSPAASAAAPDSQDAPAAAGGSSAAPSAAAGGASAAPSVAAPVVAAPAPSSAPSAAANTSSSTASTGSSTPATGSSTGTCTSPGQSICSPDGRQIGTCTSSNTVTWIPVAAGTKCAGGYMVAAKRSARFSSGYVRRNFALGPW